MKIKNLPAISTTEKHNILFLGNGINRLFEGESWESLIVDELKESGVDHSYEEIKNMPCNMQIIAASDDNVNKAMVRVAKRINQKIGNNQKNFLQEILDIDVDAIMTANYSTELEQALGMNNTSYSFHKCQHYAKDQPESMGRYRLHRYSEIDGNYIWHIHGDIYAPNSIIMGSYYYGGLVSKIHQYLKSFMQGYKYCKSHGIDYAPKSWVDYFLISNVYILGFGMSFSETDIWYLIGAKKRYFPENKTYFYIPREEISKNKEIIVLLRAYGVEIVSDYSTSHSFENYYRSAVADIKSRCLD